MNSNGFGDQQTGEVSALEAFNGYLYAGTANATAGARIFRSPDGVTWTPVTEPGFGIAHDIAPPAILDLTVFNGRLYASTGRGDGPGQIWRTLDGVHWAPMVITGFSNPDTVDISVLAVYNGVLYAGAKNLLTGAQIWRSFTGDNNTWTQVAPVTPGTAPAGVTGMAVFDGALYAAVESDAPAQIWYSYGGDWTTVVERWVWRQQHELDRGYGRVWRLSVRRCRQHCERRPALAYRRRRYLAAGDCTRLRRPEQPNG